ncbi:MAG: hypothetical protein Q9162_001041 [Coniocarpon cinnabarinum]
MSSKGDRQDSNVAAFDVADLKECLPEGEPSKPAKGKRKRHRKKASHAKKSTHDESSRLQEKTTNNAADITEEEGSTMDPSYGWSQHQWHHPGRHNGPNGFMGQDAAYQNNRQNLTFAPPNVDPNFYHNVLMNQVGPPQPYGQWQAQSQPQPFFNPQAQPFHPFQPAPPTQPKQPTQPFHCVPPQAQFQHQQPTLAWPQTSNPSQAFEGPQKNYATAYLALTNPAPTLLPVRQPLLIVLDLNGTLLDRHGSNKKSVSHRPGLRHFLDYCFANHVVMFWTTATPPSLEHMLDSILTDVTWRPKLAASWGRDTFGLSARDYNRKVDTVKDLDQVWYDRGLQARHPWTASGWSWGVGNTVLIDDSARKARKQAFNLVEVPEFKGRARMHEENDGAGVVLGTVTQYLEELRRWDNVAAFMRRWPLLF